MGDPSVLELQGVHEFGERKMGTAKAVRRLWSSTAPDLSPLAGGTRHGLGSLSPEQPGCLGGWEGQGRRKESGPPPPRPSGCPPRLPRARRSRRPEEREAEERSELSPGALRDRVPGGGGGGSAPAGEWARAAGAGGESAPCGHRGAARGVGRPVRGPSPSSRC